MLSSGWGHAPEMRIRTRILLGYSYLVALLLAGALGAAVSFYQLGRELDTILSATTSTSKMALATSFHHMTRAFLEEGAEHGEKRNRALGEFQAALGEERKQVSDDRELEILERMSRHLEELKGCSRFEESPGELRGEFFKLIETMESDFEDLIAREEAFLLEADQHLRKQARIRSMAFSLLVIVALLSLVLLSRELRRSLLDRLDELRDLAHEIRRGHSRRRAFVETPDELGLLSEAINELLDAWDEERQESRGREQRRRRMVLALLDAWEKPALIVLPDGRVLASTFGEDDKGIEKLLHDPDLAKKKLKIRMLTTPQGVDVGRLVTRK